MKRTISRNGVIRDEGDGVIAYYPSKYLFSKLKWRIENEPKKIKIGEPIQLDLGIVEK